jgi:hypothetical protein
MQSWVDRMCLSPFAVLVCAVLAFISGTATFPGTAAAGKADVLEAEVACSPAPGGRPASVCSFSVTVRHADGGWEHFANRWDVIDSDGKVVASRVLRHPHVDEQPFRRSLGNIRIPHATTSVRLRANDSMHGEGGAEVVVVVPHEAPPSSVEPAEPRPAK